MAAMTDDELTAIEARLALPLAEPTTTAAQVAADLATETILVVDVPALVAEVRRLGQQLRISEIDRLRAVRLAEDCIRSKTMT